MKRYRIFLFFAALFLSITTSCSDSVETTPPDFVGSWQLASYCGVPTEFDLYIQFKNNGQFVILQRNGSVGYTKYNGKYTANEEACTISGVYNDGEKWANEYMYGLNNDNELVLTTTSENAEVSVYRSVKMPTEGITNTICNAIADGENAENIIKPL